jgi:hypothetical protein
MDAKIWQQVSRIYHEALARKESQRNSFLKEACSENPELFQAVCRLLASHEHAAGFLDDPAFAVAARAIAGREEPARPQKSLPARVMLIVTQGPRKGKCFHFTEHKICIFGRANECFEIMPEEDPTVGRHHFLLEVNPPRIGIRDLGSLNGTFVNGKKLSGKRVGEASRRADSPGIPLVPLQDGDAVKAGDTIFTVGIQIPVCCSTCGKAMDLYRPASRPGSEEGAVFCGDCWQEHCRTGKRAETRIGAKVPVRKNCNVCGKSVESEGVARSDSEVVCPSCQAKMLKKKGLLQKHLHETSQSGRPDSIPSIQKYELRKSIGKGRLGTVYVARSKVERRQVAMKVIFSSGFADSAVSGQFNRRIEEIRNLRHPNLIEILDYGSASGSYYIVTEYSEFGNIKRLIERRRGKMGLTEALPLMQQALEGLAFIHEKRFFHGDIKPQNLLLMGREGAWRACISDTRLLTSFQELGLAGTITEEDPDALPFTPRELLTGSGVAGPTADVWSIAAIFYYMLTGRIPHDRKRETDHLVSLIEPSIIPAGQRSPDLMPELARLLDDSLSLDPRQRPADAQQMLERLRKVQVRVVHLTIAQ